MTSGTAVGNTGFGTGALASLITGDQNSAFGTQALYNLTTGNNNNAFGYNALYDNISGSDNVCVGFGALGSVNTTSQNVGIGSGAGSGSNGITACTFVGYNAKASGGTLTNVTAIGAYSFVDNNDCLVLGSIAGTNGASAYTNVGIGVSDPVAWLQVQSPVIANGNQGSLSVGEGPWDGGSPNHFAGNSHGTYIAVNSFNGFNGSLLDCQFAGASMFSVGAQTPTVALSFNSTGYTTVPTPQTLTTGGTITSQVAGFAASFIQLQAASPISTDPTTPVQAPLVDGQELKVVNVGSNTITIEAGGNATLPGGTNFSLTAGSAITFISSGSVWYTLSSSTN